MFSVSGCLDNVNVVSEPSPVNESTIKSVAAVTLLKVIHSTAVPVGGAALNVKVVPETE